MQNTAFDQRIVAHLRNLNSQNVVWDAQRTYPPDHSTFDIQNFSWSILLQILWWRIDITKAKKENATFRRIKTNVPGFVPLNLPLWDKSWDVWLNSSKEAFCVFGRFDIVMTDWYYESQKENATFRRIKTNAPGFVPLSPPPIGGQIRGRSA